MHTPQHINFGKWTNYEWYLNYVYSNLAVRIRDFIHTAGQDKYDRTFSVEPLVEFAINNTCAHKPVEYIYKGFIEELLFASIDDINNDGAYDFCIISQTTN